MQYQSIFTSPADLPENLLNVNLDIGKAYWIGNVVYVSTGTDWFQKQMGVPGPPGVVPTITAQPELVPSGIPGTSLTQPIEVQQFPSDLGETVALLFQFDQDSITGPPGPTGPIVDAPDYNNQTPPNDGDAIVWSAAEQMYMPSAFDLLGLPTYSVPESAFQSYQGTAAHQNVCTYSVPPQPFAWIPLVWGVVATIQEELFGLFNAGSVPITANVVLGSGPGQLVAVGLGNSSNYNFIQPHFSTPATPSVAISPLGATAVVPPYHTGDQGTLSCNIINNGGTSELLTILEEVGAVSFRFSAQNAQLVIMCLPVSNYIPPPLGQHILAGHGELTCDAVKL